MYPPPHMTCLTAYKRKSARPKPRSPHPTRKPALSNLAMLTHTSSAVLRVPFFLEPGYPTSEDFEESNLDRLVRKWGGQAEFEAQKRVRTCAPYEHAGARTGADVHAHT
jgi:hypothetical protein